jgi:hypothetical protein
MIETLIKCDGCGRSAVSSAATKAPVWGVLQTPDRPERDVCPACIAKLEGWDGRG